MLNCSAGKQNKFKNGIMLSPHTLILSIDPVLKRHGPRQNISDGP